MAHQDDALGEDEQAALERVPGHISEVLQEMYDVSIGAATRQRVIREIQDLEKVKERKLVVYVANLRHRQASIDEADVAPLTEALSQLSPIRNLDLMLHSPGGDGSTVEKMVDLIRNACAEEFRVIVPNLAKSAATLLALGADEILMGEPSELGPIDPQVPSLTTPYPISAYDYIDAREQLEKALKKAEQEGGPTMYLLQELAGLDIPFITHCEKLTEFSRELAAGFLRKYMLRDDPDAAAKAAETAKNLLSPALYKIHERRISARTILGRKDLHLKVKLLKVDDPFWQHVWALYVRCEVFLSGAARPGAPYAKLWETAETAVCLGPRIDVP